MSQIKFNPVNIRVLPKTREAVSRIFDAYNRNTECRYCPPREIYKTAFVNRKDRINGKQMAFIESIPKMRAKVPLLCADEAFLQLSASTIYVPEWLIDLASDYFPNKNEALTAISLFLVSDIMLNSFKRQERAARTLISEYQSEAEYQKNAEKARQYSEQYNGFVPCIYSNAKYTM